MGADGRQIRRMFLEGQQLLPWGEALGEGEGASHRPRQNHIPTPTGYLEGSLHCETLLKAQGCGTEEGRDGAEVWNNGKELFASLCFKSSSLFPQALPGRTLFLPPRSPPGLLPGLQAPVPPLFTYPPGTA